MTPRDFSIAWFPLLPGWGIALIAALLLLLIAWGSRLLLHKQVPRNWVVGLGLARMVGVLLFATCLLQPVVSYLRNRPQPTGLTVLVDVSQSMGLADGDDEQTRLAAAMESLDQSQLLETLGRKFDLKFFAFDRRAYPLEPGDLKLLTAKDDATDFAKSFAAAGDLLAAEHEETGSAGAMQRVLLVSDGRDHGGENLADAATRAGVVVDVWPVGDDRGSAPDEAIIARVQAPPRVLLASETQFVVTIERGDAAAQAYELTLREDGRDVLTQDVTMPAGVRERRVTVTYRPTETGLKQYDFSLLPKNAAAAAGGKSEPAAEPYGVSVPVVDDKLEVLVLEDRWRWEFKFLKRLLEDDPNFNLTAMLARGGGAFLQFGEPERAVDLGGFPQSRAELDWFDFIVLGDARPTSWPAGLRGAIADSVIEGGKTLIVVAGPALGELARTPELHMLLPVELSPDSATPLEGPLAVRLTPEGAQSGFFADGDRGPIIELPTLDRVYAPLRKRPGATVLLETAQQANVAGRLIVLAEQTVGRGRVLYVGTDALWKWQTLTPPDDDGRTLYGKFWQHALRAMTPSRTASTNLWLTADRTRYEAGDRVQLRAEAPAAADDKRVQLEATVVLPDERRLPITFEPDPAMADGYLAQFDAVSAGRYRIALAATRDGRPAAETSLVIEATAPRGESNDAGVDRAALAEIAARTGGRIVDPADPQTWPTPAPAPPPQIEERRTVNLWENFLLVTLLCLVLGGDWLARLLRGYT